MCPCNVFENVFRLSEIGMIKSQTVCHYNAANTTLLKREIGGGRWGIVSNGEHNSSVGKSRRSSLSDGLLGMSMVTAAVVVRDTSLRISKIHLQYISIRGYDIVFKSIQWQEL